MNSLGLENLQGFPTAPAEALSAPKIEKDVTGSKTFASMLQSSLENVNELQHQADIAIKETLAGRNKNIHETMLAIEKADTSLKLMMQVRNKILDAYREVMKMQL
jgi:flagellar hook-basal body complex protein FliE